MNFFWMNLVTKLSLDVMNTNIYLDNFKKYFFKIKNKKRKEREKETKNKVVIKHDNVTVARDI